MIDSANDMGWIMAAGSRSASSSVTLGGVLIVTGEERGAGGANNGVWGMSICQDAGTSERGVTQMAV